MSAAHEPDVADVVAVVDPELTTGSRPRWTSRGRRGGGGRGARGICRATTRPTTPVRAAAADRTTDVVTRRTRGAGAVAASSFRGAAPEGLAGDGGDSGGWE